MSCLDDSLMRSCPSARECAVSAMPFTHSKKAQATPVDEMTTDSPITPRIFKSLPIVPKPVVNKFTRKQYGCQSAGWEV